MHGGALLQTVSDLLEGLVTLRNNETKKAVTVTSSNTASECVDACLYITDNDGA